MLSKPPVPRMHAPQLYFTTKLFDFGRKNLQAAPGRGEVARAQALTGHWSNAHGMIEQFPGNLPSLLLRGTVLLFPFLCSWAQFEGNKELFAISLSSFVLPLLCFLLLFLPLPFCLVPSSPNPIIPTIQAVLAIPTLPVFRTGLRIPPRFYDSYYSSRIVPTAMTSITQRLLPLFLLLLL